MGNPTYHNEVMTRYLLGALPEVESERFDDLSISDEEFAESLSAAEKDLVDAYLQGELTGENRKQFESHYLASPLRREKVQFARALQDWDAMRPAAAVTSKTEIKKDGWFTGWLGFNPRPLAWGLSGLVVILLVGGSWLIFENQRLRRQVAQIQASSDTLAQRAPELQKELATQRASKTTTEEELARLRSEHARVEQELKDLQRAAGREQQRSSTSTASVASFILAPQMRGVGSIKTVTVPSETERVAIQLELEPNEYSTYIVALIDQASGQVLWRSGRLKAAGASGHKSLSVGFPGRLLRAATYRMQVSGMSPAGAPEVVTEYPFRVVKQ